MKFRDRVFDISIDGRRIPWFAWLCIGIAVVIIGIGICTSLIIRGSVSFKAKAVNIQASEQLYSEKINDK